MAHCPGIILLVFRYLNNCRASAEPDAEIPEAHGGKKVLSLLHLPQSFLCMHILVEQTAIRSLFL